MNENRVPWQRMALSLFGIIIVVALWKYATWHLYTRLVDRGV